MKNRLLQRIEVLEWKNKPAIYDQNQKKVKEKYFHPYRALLHLQPISIKKMTLQKAISKSPPPNLPIQAP